MTRKEAVKILETEITEHINKCQGVYYETRTAAVNMGITALKFVDYIYFMTSAAQGPEIGERTNVIKLSEAPESGVTPIRARGRWVGIDGNNTRWGCVCCGSEVRGEANIDKYRYCPNCGAEMGEK